jgi:hypothetical protein
MHAVLPPVLDLLHFRRPRVRRIFCFLDGFVRGLLMPLDRSSVRFIEPPVP